MPPLILRGGRGELPFWSFLFSSSNIAKYLLQPHRYPPTHHCPKTALPQCHSDSDSWSVCHHSSVGQDVDCPFPLLYFSMVRGCTCYFVLSLRVGATIQFNSQEALRAVKIQDIRPEAVLPEKFEALQSSVSQMLP